ncbi:hypothetical protein ACFL0I_04200, partial [Gemmatimonadota bacterium]
VSTHKHGAMVIIADIVEWKGQFFVMDPEGSLVPEAFTDLECALRAAGGARDEDASTRAGQPERAPGYAGGVVLIDLSRGVMEVIPPDDD